MGRSRGPADGSPREIGPATLVLARLARDSVRQSRPIAFDTPALIAYLDDVRPAATLLAPLFEDPSVPIVLSTVVVAEVLTLPAKIGNRDLFDSLQRSITELPGLLLLELDMRSASETARVRAQTELKLPDAAIIAAARLASAIAIIGNDRRWRNRQLGLPYFLLNDLAESEAQDE
jgi:uncharacterized protein